MTLATTEAPGLPLELHDKIIRDLIDGHNVRVVASRYGFTPAEVRAIGEAAGMIYNYLAGRTMCLPGQRPDRVVIAEVINVRLGEADLAHPVGWQDLGDCSQVDPEIFFPDRGGSNREAKAICRGCPVRVECLSYAMETSELYGIWGGLSERDRRKLHRRIADHDRLRLVAD